MITVSTTTRPPLKHAWREGISVGAAHELLRADLQQHLRLLQKEIGYRHIRFHASFHDDVGVVHRAADGTIYYTWSQLDKIYDFLVEAGFDPIVEINPMPAALASTDKTFFWYKMNISPPKDYEEWRAFIEAVISHFTERYGQRRVKNWLFEVWNEPNLRNNFWSGDFDEYVHLYTVTALAVKAVCPAYRVGGPAGAGGGWNLPLARACRAQQVPLDFVSFHNYPAGEYGAYPNREGSPHAPGQQFIDCFRSWREELDREGFRDLPALCTEWSTLTCDAQGKPEWVGSPDITRLYSGAAACHYAVGTDPFVDVFTWWAASDVFFEAGPHLQVYGQHNQYYGMVTINGTPKPAFHAFRYLARMQGPVMALEQTLAPPAQAGMLATREPDCLRFLLWNFQIPQEQGAIAWRDIMKVPAALLGGTGQVRVTTAQVRAGQGSGYEAWQSWGKPVNLTRLEEEALVAACLPAHAVRVIEPLNGHVEIPFALQRDEILFIEVRVNAGVADVGAMSERLAKLDQALNELK